MIFMMMPYLLFCFLFCIIVALLFSVLHLGYYAPVVKMVVVFIAVSAVDYVICSRDVTCPIFSYNAERALSLDAPPMEEAGG